MAYEVNFVLSPTINSGGFNISGYTYLSSQTLIRSGISKSELLGLGTTVYIPDDNITKFVVESTGTTCGGTKVTLEAPVVKVINTSGASLDIADLHFNGPMVFEPITTVNLPYVGHTIGTGTPATLSIDLNCVYDHAIQVRCFINGIDTGIDNGYFATSYVQAMFTNIPCQWNDLVQIIISDY